MADRLDILILGATGFTGLHCIPYVAKFSKSHGRNLSWGIAGRSEDKLKAVLKQMGEKLDTNFDSIPVIVADITDQESLVNMAKKAKLVINCCGPYRFLGQQVVQACIEAGTHHIDVSGEPGYMEKVQVENYDDALEKGVYVISACGLDSIPVDLGTVYLQQIFEGTLNSVETYLKFWSEGSNKESLMNFGTWDSAVHGVSNRSQLGEIRKKLNEKFPKPPKLSPQLPFKVLPFKPKVAEGWAVPFPGADRVVARRSQGYLYEHENIRPVQVGTYFLVPSFLTLLILTIYAAIFGIFSHFAWGRKLLLRYPEIFSGGLFSKESPSEEAIENSWFSIDFYGEGWKEKLINKDDTYTTPVDKYIKARITGRNPGYGSTCVALVLAGIVLLTEKDKLANNGKGGVYPPGAAFAKTSLMKQLNENGLTLEIIGQGDLKKE